MVSTSRISPSSSWHITTSKRAQPASQSWTIRWDAPFWIAAETNTFASRTTFISSESVRASPALTHGSRFAGSEIHRLILVETVLRDVRLERGTHIGSERLPR